MSLVGNLEDLGLGDILQIVSLSRKSGVLYLRGEPNAEGRRAEGEIIFQNGQVIRATSSEATQNLGELLLARGVVTPSQVEEALSIQRAGGGRERLGNVLIKHVHVSADKIQEAIRRQIEAIVYTFFQWQRGDFSFELKEADGALDKVDLEMRHMVLDVGLNPQFLAMEGTRLKDEAKRVGRVDPGLLPVRPRPVAPAAEMNGHEAGLEVPGGTSTDPEGPRRFSPPEDRPASPTAGPRRFPPSDGPSSVADGASFAEFSVDPSELEGRPGAAAAPEVPGGTGTAPGVPGGTSPAPGNLRRFPPPGDHRASSTAGGASTAPTLPGGTSPAPGDLRRFPPPGDHRASSTTVDLTAELGLTRGAAALGGQSSRGLGMLRAMISELTNPDAHGQITLLILRFAAEMMRRAVLFLVKDDEVLGLGQFGIELPGENADRVVRGIRVPRHEPSTFADVLRRRAAYTGPLGEAAWDGRLVEALGGHRPAEVFCAPITSGAMIAALLYADNAPEDTPIGDTEALEIFLHQAGVQMEKALLERRIRELNRPGR